ncbi:P-loop NTPase fold protein [Paraglaciecola aquimarina]|uniref:P-loop NTPase fold protein n=1 Tax=Paraglaciecola aquimarina TaxID=1235557 RepID=A0ABU3SVG6_9ALTE|nr:P-loop NTPase fold protein [Paraglaciecola aquimarina]MDU0353922.1 P-loop NTPase fold protein [Paraglaciecola aquimarina]
MAGLLSAVQAHAIPEIWTSAGLLYRWNLFKMRCSESPLVYVIASLFFFGSMSYWLTLQDLNFHVIQESTDEDRWQNITVLLTTLMGGVPLILASMNNLSSMVGSNNPLKMLLGSPGNSLDLRSNVGLRQKFAKEFHMLCRALGDTTLTIFIDDLDRCKESRIMDVMETLNYLVCSGDCYIILGIEREPIEKAIINYYRNTHQDLSNEELQRKARRYLEKIINIEIPVPTAKSSQVSSLIVSDEHPTSLTTKKWKWLAPVLFFAALLSSIILGSYFAGVISINTTNQTQPSSVAAPKVQGGPTLETVEAEPTVQGASSSNTPTWTFEKPQPEYQFINVILPFLFVGLIALIIRLERYKQHKHIVEQDSAPFIAAIAVWAKALGTSSHTPRSIKRYVNRARYLAMRNIASNTHIKEENLVTLAALLEFADQNDFTGIDNLQRFIPSFEDETLAREVDDLLTKSANITEQRKQQFLHWVKGIQVN